MPLPLHPGSQRDDDIVGSLWLLAWLAVAVLLMVLDSRGGWLHRIRTGAESVVQPVWRLAGVPGQLRRELGGNARSYQQLLEENRGLRNRLLVEQARGARLQVVADESARLRSQLGAMQEQHLDVQLVPILDIDLDPVRQRLVLAAGSGQGVRVGQVVIDAGGLLGQVVAVTTTTSTVLLLTDPDHAVPVAVARNGVRLIVHGDGRSDHLRLVNIPLSSDVKVGDTVVTSGLGQRFPAGFAVGTVRSLQPDESRAFLVGDLVPAARLDRGRDVLLLRRVLAPLASAPPPPPPPPQWQLALPGNVAAGAAAPAGAAAGASTATPAGTARTATNDTSTVPTPAPRAPTRGDQP